MKNKSVYYLTQTAVIAALYAVLTIFQSVIFPESTSAAIQFRVSEALTILALYTNAAIPALTLGCVLANISSVAVLGPLDMIFGSIASLLAALTIYLLRNVRFFRLDFSGSRFYHFSCPRSSTDLSSASKSRFSSRTEASL